MNGLIVASHPHSLTGNVTCANTTGCAGAASSVTRREVFVDQRNATFTIDLDRIAQCMTATISREPCSRSPLFS